MGGARHIPVIHIVGRSNSGKTTLLERIIAELTSRGLAVGTVKHHHKGDIDTRGKDSWRHGAAGAKAVGLVGEKQFAVFRSTDGEASLQDVIGALGEVDLVLVEGFKRVPGARIEVVRSQNSTQPTTDPDTLLALVTDVPALAGACSHVFAFDEIVGLADLIEAAAAESDKGEVDASKDG